MCAEGGADSRQSLQMYRSVFDRRDLFRPFPRAIKGLNEVLPELNSKKSLSPADVRKR